MLAAAGSSCVSSVLRSNTTWPLLAAEQRSLAKDFGATETIGNGHVIRKNAPLQSMLSVVFTADLANP